MDPLWKLISGEFAGWRVGDALHDAQGDNVGCFIEDIAFSLGGEYIGELYAEDRIGIRAMVSRGQGPQRAPKPSIAVAPLPARSGLMVTGWDDPPF